MRPRVGAIARLVVVELELGRVLESSRRHLGRDVEVHRLRHTASQLTKRVARVFVHAARDDHAFAVPLQSFGRGLLVAELNAGFGVLGADGHVAGHDQERRACGVGACNRADHVGEPWPLGAGCHGDFAGHADERVGGMRHRPFMAPAVCRNAGCRHRVDDGVVARTGEKRGDAFFLAGAREYLGAGHREVEADRRRRRGGGELGRHANRCRTAARRSAPRLAARPVPGPWPMPQRLSRRHLPWRSGGTFAG